MLFEDPNVKGALCVYTNHVNSEYIEGINNVVITHSCTYEY